MDEMNDSPTLLPSGTKRSITRYLRKVEREGTKYAYTCENCGREFRATRLNLHCPHCGYNGHPATAYGDPRHEEQWEPIDPQYTHLANTHVYEVERKIDLYRMLLKLTERERLIVEFRYGLRGQSAHTLDECGKRFNVTRERVRQIEAQALRKLLAMDTDVGRELRLWAAAKREGPKMSRAMQYLESIRVRGAEALEARTPDAGGREADRDAEAPGASTTRQGGEA